MVKMGDSGRGELGGAVSRSEGGTVLYSRQSQISRRQQLTKCVCSSSSNARSV